MRYAHFILSLCLKYFLLPPAQESENINIMGVSVSNTGWFKRTIKWNTSYNESGCVDSIVVFGDNEHAATGYSYTLSELPLTFSTNGTVQAVVNGVSKSNLSFVVDTSRKYYTIKIMHCS